MKKFFQIKIIRKYLFSYLLLFSLPLIALNGFFYFHFQRTLQKELVHNQEISLEKLQISTESELSKLQLISRQLILNGYAAPFELSDNPVKGTRLIQSLNSYKNVTPFLSDIIIYFEDSDYFYSTTSSYTSEYFKLLYKNQPEILNHLSDFLVVPSFSYTAPASIIPPSSDQTENLVMVYPLSQSSFNNYGVLLFLFSEDNLEHLFEQYYDPSITTVLLGNSTGEVLSVWGDHNDTVLNHYQSNADHLTDTSHSIQDIEKEDYLITTAHSNSFGWSYYAYTKVDSALSASISSRNQQLYFSILAILAGGLLITLCMYYNFLPLYHLIDLAAGLSVPIQQISGNELDAIADTLSQLSSENSQLNTRLENTKTAAKDYIIGQLLTGHTLKREFLEASLVKTVLSPHYDRYCVFLTHFNQAAPLMDAAKLEIIDKIESFSGDHIVFLCKEDLKFNFLITIAFMNHHITPQLPGILSSLKASLKDSFNCTSACGVGKTYDLLENLSKSYIESSTALDYRFIKGSDATIFFSDIELIAQGNISSHYYDQIQQFSQALAARNIDLLEQSLNDISFSLSNDHMTLFQSKSICQDIINIVTKAVPEIQAENEADSSFPDTFLVSQFENVDDIIKLVRQLSYDICKHINSSYDEDNHLLIEHIRDFIVEKSFDCNFSLEMLSDHFHMGASNLSAFYKEQTGENIFETATQIRMEKAKFLLSSTSLPVNQICLNVGYDNVSSFIRRFKQLYHMTPGAWREHHSHV